MPDAPKGVVLITHGYAEHCGRYREVAHVITNAGWAALSYDCRGHGQSPGDRGYIDRFVFRRSSDAQYQVSYAHLGGSGAWQPGDELTCRRDVGPPA